MNMVKLSVHGDDPTLKSILEVLPTDPERQWRKGEAKGAAGRVHLDSGFEVVIAQASKAQVLPSRIRSYLAECRSRGVTFSMPRIVAELQLELNGDRHGRCAAGPDPGRHAAPDGDGHQPEPG